MSTDAEVYSTVKRWSASVIVSMLLMHVWRPGIVA